MLCADTHGQEDTFTVVIIRAEGIRRIFKCFQRDTNKKNCTTKRIIFNWPTRVVGAVGVA